METTRLRLLISSRLLNAIPITLRLLLRSEKASGPIWHARYQSAKLFEAKSSLERALSQIPDDSVAKLYLALTNLRLQTTEKAANPFTLQDVSFALRERIEPKRVAALVRERGVAFDLTAESESQLRKGGADDLFSMRLKRSAPKP